MKHGQRNFAAVSGRRTADVIFNLFLSLKKKTLYEKKKFAGMCLLAFGKSKYR